MGDFSYNSDLNGGSLMVRESRIIADLLLRGATQEVWNQEIQTENRLQKRSPTTARRNAQAIRKRLELMGPEFWRALRDGDQELATQVAFAATLERNLLLVEFVDSVLRDLYITHAEKIDIYKWLEFLEDRSYRDPQIESWTESTKRKMGQVVLRILAESGYLASTRSLILQKVSVRPELRVLLEDTYRHKILDCMDVSSRH